jgi:hypothetical protein
MRLKERQRVAVEFDSCFYHSKHFGYKSRKGLVEKPPQANLDASWNNRFGFDEFHRPHDRLYLTQEMTDWFKELGYVQEDIYLHYEGGFDGKWAMVVPVDIAVLFKLTWA